MSINLIADPGRRTASRLAYRLLEYDHLDVYTELAELAPHLTDAERTAALAELADAQTLHDGVDKVHQVAKNTPHLVGDTLGAIDPKHIPAAARDAYGWLLAEARLRKAITDHDLDRLEGQTDHLDTAIARKREVDSGELQAGGVEPENADPVRLDIEAEADLTAALADVAFRVELRVDAALAEVRAAVEQRLEAAYRALLGGRTK